MIGGDIPEIELHRRLVREVQVRAHPLRKDGIMRPPTSTA
jgi:hypothetical protein